MLQNTCNSAVSVLVVWSIYMIENFVLILVMCTKSEDSDLNQNLDFIVSLKLNLDFGWGL